ncbi:MAG TPA: GDP-mannose 4,6-dehydratase [Gemmataceae bacterium]|nr:GDP-mannose 4,6-dehydratase [Gemmataceae bacterium]
MRNLVTGATGFAGGHLVEVLLSRGNERIVGVARQAVWPEAWGHLTGRVELRPCNVGEPTAVEAILRDVQPERIYHLAGYPHVGRSFQEVEEAWQGNLKATRCLYDGVTRWGGRPRILYVGSGLVYGESETTSLSCDEQYVLHPDNPYAASKAAADLMSYQYTRHPGLDIVRVRPFTHIGPHQSPQFAVSSFARQLAAIERGQQKPVLETGNLQARRDLSDVRDVVAAYVLLLERGRSGEVYNVGSGQTFTMQTVLDRLIALSGVTVEVRQKASLLRATDVAVIRANTDKLRQETGWSPRFTLDQTLADTLAYWREHPGS